MGQTALIFPSILKTLSEGPRYCLFTHSINCAIFTPSGIHFFQPLPPSLSAWQRRYIYTTALSAKSVPAFHRSQHVLEMTMSVIFNPAPASIFIGFRAISIDDMAAGGSIKGNALASSSSPHDKWEGDKILPCYGRRREEMRRKKNIEIKLWRI